MAKTKKTEKTEKVKIPRNVSYLRVSGEDQETEKNKADILKFVQERAFGHVEFVEEKFPGKFHGRVGRSKRSSTS